MTLSSSRPSATWIPAASIPKASGTDERRQWLGDAAGAVAAVILVAIDVRMIIIVMVYVIIWNVANGH